MATESASSTCRSEQRPCSMTAPRVSFVMGAYNGERFLRPAIESILNQTVLRLHADHDDVSLPTRLEYQVAFLDKHAQVGMVGSSCSVIDEVGTRVAYWPLEYGRPDGT